MFLILREIACWYWKINERIALMQEQNELLRKLVAGSFREEKVKEGGQAVKPVENRTEETEAILEPKVEMVNKMAGIPQKLLDKLSLAQIAKAEKLIEEMGETDMIVHHDHTIKLISKDRWNDLVNSGESEKLEIVYRRQ